MAIRLNKIPKGRLLDELFRRGVKPDEARKQLQSRQDAAWKPIRCDCCGFVINGHYHYPKSKQPELCGPCFEAKAAGHGCDHPPKAWS